MKNSISIIVPIYNAEKYLKKCLDSLVSQTYEDMEIIAVDDGSTDQSSVICDEYQTKFNNLKVVHKENGGLVSAWKAGLASSCGKYVCFVDGDDWVDHDMVSQMAVHLSGSDREIVCSDYIIERHKKSIDDDTSVSEYVYQTMAPGEYQRDKVVSVIIPELLGNEHRAIATSRCMKLIGRKLVEENTKYCDEKIRMGEDSTIMLPVLMDADRIYIMDKKAYYHYEFVGNSMIHQYDANAYNNVRLLYKTLGDMIRDKFADDNEKREFLLKRLDMEYVFLLMIVLKNEARNPSKDYIKNMFSITRDPKIADLVQNTSVTVNDRSNKLIYLALKRPGRLTSMILRSALKFYDRQYR